MCGVLTARQQGNTRISQQHRWRLVAWVVHPALTNCTGGCLQQCPDCQPHPEPPCLLTAVQPSCLN